MTVVLFEPEIPPNTGNIARLCAAFDVELHLIEPLGFRLEDRYLKRAGLDYWPNVRLRVWPDWSAFCAGSGLAGRKVMASAKSGKPLPEFHFEQDDILVFGPETRGLPKSLLEGNQLVARIPVRKMKDGGVRSLNLSSACAIVLYAALLSCGLLGRFY